MKFYKENKVNPLASCLPLVLQIPIFFALFFVLRDFDDEVFPKYPDSDLGWLNVVPNITENINTHWSGWLLLVDLRRQPARLDLLHVDGDGPAPALHLPGAPVRLHLLRHQLPDRPDALLVDDEPLDRRPGPRHAPPRAEAAAAAEANLADAAQGAGSGAEAAALARAGSAATAGEAGRQRPAAGPAQEEEGPEGEAVSEPENQAPDDGRRRERRRDRRRGEVDGAARARAPLPRARQGAGPLHRRLRGRAGASRRRPGAGAGRWRASTRRRGRPRRRARSRARPRRSSARCSSRSARRSARRATIDVVGGRRAHLRDVDRPRARPVIGKRGHTIDAIQYLANAILWRAPEGERKEVIVDAAGYRERRRELPGGHGRPGRLRCAAGRACGGARADDGGRAQDRPRPPRRARGRRHLERRDGAEPPRRRRARPCGVTSVDPRLERWLEALLATPGLTAARDPAEARRVHVDDALAAPALVEEGPSSTSDRAAARPGSRSPSARPDLQVDLLEAQRRKCAFLERPRRAFPNVEVVCARAEEHGSRRREGGYGDRAGAGAGAAAGRAGVVPSARPRRAAGSSSSPARSTWKRPRLAAAPSAAARPRSSPLAGSERRSLLVVPKVAPTPERLPAPPRRSRGNVLSPD